MIHSEKTDLDPLLNYDRGINYNDMCLSPPNFRKIYVLLIFFEWCIIRIKLSKLAICW